jgi:hypothetical protein
MISVGGLHQYENSDDWGTWIDPWANGLGIFDLSALNWTNTYNHTAAPYERSSLVASYYSSNARYPESWADPVLQAIFEANTTSAQPSSSPTSSPSPEQSSTRAIAGGVIGGVVALAIIGGAIFWCLRKKRRSIQRSAEIQGPTYLSGPAELDLNPAARAELLTERDYQTIPAVTYEMPGSRPAVYELHARP